MPAIRRDRLRCWALRQDRHHFRFTANWSGFTKRRGSALRESLHLIWTSITLCSLMNFRVTSGLFMRFFLIILIYSLKMFTSPTERLQKMKFSTIAGSMNRRLNGRADWMCSCLESDGPDISDLKIGRAHV